MKRLTGNAFVLALAILPISALMLCFTGIIPALGDWYSYDPSLRLQSDAFLRGELAIQPVPYGGSADWIWSNGMHQGWGLGIPMIQLPFHVFGKLFGFFGFPERIIFLIFYVLVAAIVIKCFGSNIHGNLDIKERLTTRIICLPVFLFIFLNPTFITMLRSKFQVYEEVVAYAYLWSFMCLALMYKFINSRQSYLFFILCLLSGFSLILRPTHGAYGTMTFLIGLYYANQSRIRFYWIGIPLFLVGIIFSLMTNYLRFGSPVEFGNKLQLLGSGIGYYMISFDNPFNWFPYSTSAVELISALFFLDIDRLHMTNQTVLWQTNKLRGFQLDFIPYNVVTLILLLLGWIVFIVSFRASRRDISSGNLRKKQIIQALGIWSIVSFMFLFLFYSQYPALTARYLVDFAPAIVVGIVILYWVLIDFIHNELPEKLSFWLSIALSIAFASWIFVDLSRAIIIRLPLFNHMNKTEYTNVTNAEIAKQMYILMRRTNGPPLPSGYRCGDKEYIYDIPVNNNYNWDISDSCRVSLVSTHFLDNPNCLAIDVEPIGYIPDMVWEDALKDIEVRVGIDRFRQKGVTSMEYGKTITYCSEGKKGYENPDYVKYKFVQIKWIDLRKYPNFTSPPIRLTYLRKIN